jgi:hypothetical protein
MNILYNNKRKIGVIRLTNRQEIPVKAAECRSNIYDIDKVLFDTNSLGTYITVSKSLNVLQIFQSQGSGNNFNCKA